MQIRLEGRTKNIVVLVVVGHLRLPLGRHPEARYGTYSEMWQSPDRPGLDELLREEASGTARFGDGCLVGGPGSTMEFALAEKLI